jgi:putative flippase GtrA
MKWRIQLSRYAIVGLASNAVGYILYLGLTALGMGHKTAMTLLFVVGVLQTFVFNKRWSFEHRGAAGGALLRYSGIYGIAYLLNLAALIVLVDTAGMPHQLVQGVLILLLAGMLFLLQKYWVFRPIETYPTTDSARSQSR